VRRSRLGKATVEAASRVKMDVRTLEGDSELPPDRCDPLAGENESGTATGRPSHFFSRTRLP